MIIVIKASNYAMREGVIIMHGILSMLQTEVPPKCDNSRDSEVIHYTIDMWSDIERRFKLRLSDIIDSRPALEKKIVNLSKNKKRLSEIETIIDLIAYMIKRKIFEPETLFCISGMYISHQYVRFYKNLLVMNTIIEDDFSGPIDTLKHATLLQDYVTSNRKNGRVLKTTYFTSTIS